jgi:hypothetical protein
LFTVNSLNASTSQISGAVPDQCYTLQDNNQDDRVEISGGSSASGSQISIVGLVENGHQSKNSKSNLTSSKGKNSEARTGRRSILEEVVLDEEMPEAPQQENVNIIEQDEERPGGSSFHDEDMSSQFDFRNKKFKVRMNNSSDQMEMETCIIQYKVVLSRDYEVFVLPTVYSTTDVSPKKGTKLRTKQWVVSISYHIINILIPEIFTLFTFAEQLHRKRGDL